MLKKIAKITGIVLIALLLIAFILPFAFKGKIMAIAKTEINKNLNANVDFKDVNISLFRRFPRLAVGLEGLRVVGTGDFSKDTLMSARQIDVALNLMSLFGGNQMKIYSVVIDQPRIHAIVNKEGKANWDITLPDTAAVAETESNFNVQLKNYSIKDGYINYIDIPGDMSSEIFHLNHSGSGDFTADLFTLKTKTSAESVSYTYTKIPYLVNSKVFAEADIQVDTKNDKYTFKTDDIQLNDLNLSSEGYFQFVNDTTYGMDIKFNAPSTEFKTLLSLVPAIYKNDFDKIKTSGKAVFNGFVKGEYNSVKMPAYLVNLNVEDGFFQYPDLPQPVKNIAIAMKVENPDGVMDNTVIDISKGHIEFGNDPFDFSVLFKKPETDQYIDARVKGKLNLAQVTQFIKLTDDTKLSGLLDADAGAKGNMAVITQQKPGPFTANGFINITGLNYSSKDFPQPVRNSNIRVRLENPDGIADHTIIEIPAAHIEVGDDPIDFNVRIKNPATTLYFEGNAKGKFNLANAAQFTRFEPGTQLSGLLSANMAFKGNKADIDKEAYDRIHLSGSLNIAGLQYTGKDYPTGIKISEAAFTFNPKNITLNSLKAEYLQSNISAHGSLDNAIGYALKDEPVAGTLNVHADKLNLNELLGTDTATSESAAATEPFLVPQNIAFTLLAAVDQLSYDKTSYNNVKGILAIKDETVTLKNLQMDALDGKIGLNGYYSTKTDKKHPDISLSYDVRDLSVEKTFYAFNTVQQLMPIGKFISGVVSSQLSLTGKLGGDMMPVMGSLTGNGNLLLLQGVLKKFAPLEKMAQTLQVADLNGLTLKDIKTSFEFSNGKVLVKPFHVKVKDIDMEIGGMHGLDQSINYVIGMQVPRAMIGTEGNALINNLAQQAAGKGIPVKLSDHINLNLKMGGTITNPQIHTDLKESAGDAVADMKQQAADFAQQKIEDAKKALEDSVKSIKTELVKDLKEEAAKQLLGGNKNDSSAAAQKPLEETKKKAEEAVKSTLKDLLKKKPQPEEKKD
ncbi:MAG: AsmA family protein [Chitinophagaceae bacterium]|nr:AsmA family protein [Chitinophagaceae bacterium]